MSFLDNLGPDSVPPEPKSLDPMDSLPACSGSGGYDLSFLDNLGPDSLPPITKSSSPPSGADNPPKIRNDSDVEEPQKPTSPASPDENKEPEKPANTSTKAKTTRTKTNGNVRK